MSDLTLNDIATLLVGITPDDLPEIMQVRAHFSEKLDAGTLLGGAARFATGIVEKLDAVVFEKPKDSQELLDAIGRDLEKISSGIDGDTAATTSESSDLPVIEEDTSYDSGEDDEEELDPEFIAEGVGEAQENIEAAEASLLDLEDDPSNKDALDSLFRAYHSVKGICGMIGVAHIQHLAHLTESLMDRARKDEIVLEGIYSEVVLDSTASLKSMLVALKSGKKWTDGVREKNLIEFLEGKTEEFERADAPESEPDQKTSEADSTIRVSTGYLDNLVDMVGELVIAHSMVEQDTETMPHKYPPLSKKVVMAGKITRRIQKLSMALRMVPLKATFRRMTRLVRDLAKKTGKEIDFVTFGEQTEVDRSLVELLADPLIHMLRNSCDHGIQTPDLRKKAGKTGKGRITLSARHESGQVVIELEDDGKGLDAEMLRNKAVEKGLITAEAELTHDECLNLVFLPGFSTAEKVSDVSGRGVGMDVVRRNAEQLRGKIELQSELGVGTKFILRFPLTLAMIDGMVFKIGNQTYIVPVYCIRESIQPSEKSLVLVMGKGEMVRLRGELLSLFRLCDLFGIEGAEKNPEKALLLIVEEDGRSCAIMVDELIGQQQIVVKPMASALVRADGISGAAILGDGRVRLIIDVKAITLMTEEQKKTDV